MMATLFSSKSSAMDRTLGLDVGKDAVAGFVEVGVAAESRRGKVFAQILVAAENDFSGRDDPGEHDGRAVDHVHQVNVAVGGGAKFTSQLEQCHRVERVPALQAKIDVAVGALVDGCEGAESMHGDQSGQARCQDFHEWD